MRALRAPARASVYAPTTRALIFGLIAAAFALYARTFAYPPLWDDHFYVEEQAFLRDPRALAAVLDPRQFLRILPTANAARPVWLFSVLLDRALLGWSFWALRASSTLWYGVGAALLAALVWELTTDAAAAAAAGFLFVAHPLHAEVVEIVSFRADTLAFLFGVLALLLHLRAWRSEHPKPLRLAALAAFGLALLSKESAAAVVVLLPVVDSVACPAPPWRTRARVYAAFVLLLAAYLYYRTPRAGYESSAGPDVFTELAQREPALFGPVSQPSDDWARAPVGLGSGRHRDPRPWDQDFSAPRTHLRTLVVVQGSNLLRLFWPWPLQGDYAPKTVRRWLDPRLAATLAGWMVLLGLAAAMRRRAPLLSAGLLWIPAALLPVSGIVAMRNLTADRYLYFASAGVCLALSALVTAPFGRGTRARRAAFILCGVVAAFWIELGQMRLPDFRSDAAYFAATIAVDPDVPRARCNLGLAEWREGRLDAAETDLRAALTLWPQSRQVRANLADLLQSRGRADEARALLNAVP